MKAVFITAKTAPKALQILRLIAAHTGEKPYAVLERLLRTALRKIEKATQQ